MKTVKQKSKLNHWTPLAIIGLIAIILVAVIAIFPFIYMILMSFTDSRTLQPVSYTHLLDILPDCIAVWLIDQASLYA